MKSKRDEVARFNIAQAQVEGVILYLILSIGCHSIKRDTIWIANKVLMLT
jgi:hypothetical protein